MPLRLSRQLATLTLDDILSGKTCTPISLLDFESFLTHKQHSVEYLRFMVWYQSYRSRFMSLPYELQALSSPVSGTGFTDDGVIADFKLPSPARLARFTSKTSSMTLFYQTHAAHPQADQQPFRVECSSVVNTFLVPNTSSAAPSNLMTLNIPATLLDATLAHLTQTTHPSVFHPIYQLAYETLQASSLPFFLADAEPNINREKQLYWWLYGAAIFLLGWVVTIGCLFIEFDGGSHVFAQKRVWRLWAVPLLTLGGMQMYSAYRGFCSEVWGRGAMQLRPWELVGPPSPLETEPKKPMPYRLKDEGRNHTAHLSSSTSSSTSSEGSQAQAEVARTTIHVTNVAIEEVPDFDLDLNEPGPINFPCPIAKKPITAPIITSCNRDICNSPTVSWLLERDEIVTAPSTPFTPTSAHAFLPRSPPPPPVRYPPHSSFPSSEPSISQPELSTRARIFGPERVVLDPRIRAVHRKVMRDILVAGFVWGVVWTVVILCLPWA